NEMNDVYCLRSPSLVSCVFSWKEITQYPHRVITGQTVINSDAIWQQKGLRAINVMHNPAYLLIPESKRPRS
ncbi:hypothetical protein, partial [Escherichia coli]|uniref:hypothetical protein n=1 Tax=Escherichia coli TaxID=562 RepID=UPI0038968E34